MERYKLINNNNTVVINSFYLPIFLSQYLTNISTSRFKNNFMVRGSVRATTTLANQGGLSEIVREYRRRSKEFGKVIWKETLKN